MSRGWMILYTLALISCGNSPPSPPVVSPPATNETINGSERIGWDQSAADAVDLAAIGYAIYVDGARTPLTGVTCASAAAAAGFPCSARLPALPTGSHTLELASFVNDGGVLESARSAPLRVTVVAQTATLGSGPRLRDGLSSSAGVLADGLASATDLAFTRDGRLFIAERAGRIRIVRDGRLLSEPAISLADTIGTDGALLALAVDPQFERTHLVFAIYTAPDPSGASTFTLARFREVSNTLGDRAVLLDRAAIASPSPTATLGFGPDGKLYAALDDGGDARHRRDPASLNGKVLRLNTDGTTPVDAAGGTPVYGDGYGAPVALDWDPPTATLWIADRAAGSSAFAFYRGALFQDWAGRMLSAGTLFDSASAAGVSRLAVGPDGAIYYVTAQTVGRITPGQR